MSLNLEKMLELPGLSDYQAQIKNEINFIFEQSSPLIAKSLTRFAKAPSKQLRSALLIAMAQINGAKVDKQVLRACVAVELVHMASLIHDDIIDKSSTRWGLPTINSLEGNNIAIVIGDYLFAKAGEQAAMVSGEVARIIELTIARLCAGQICEMADAYNLNRTIESYFETINGKTAALFSAACQIAGLCSDFEVQEIEAATQYGLAFGTAFQLIDDLLDILSDKELMGKPPANDIKEGVYTLAVLSCLHGPRSKQFLAILKGETTRLIKFMIKEDAFKSTFEEINKYNQSAAFALAPFPETKVLKSLKKFPNNYLSWSMKYQISEEFRDGLVY